MTKDKRLQIRLTDQEFDGIKRRAKAVGLSVADYGRKRMLADDLKVVSEQEPMDLDGEWTGNLEGEPAASYADFQAEADWEGDEPLSDELKGKLMEEHGIEFSDWVPTIPGRDECSVKDLPPGVRCIECGKVHGT